MRIGTFIIKNETIVQAFPALHTDEAVLFQAQLLGATHISYKLGINTATIPFTEHTSVQDLVNAASRELRYEKDN